MISRIVYENGNPWIDIDGKKIEPSAFRSFRPKPDNLSLITRCGVRLCQMLVSGRPCSNGAPYSLFGGVWKGEGEYDFSAFDQQYAMFRRFAPDAYYNVMLHLDTPQWWKEAHPDLPDNSYHHISELAAYEEFRKAVSDYLKAFITYAEEKYGNRIFGYSFACGNSNEWFDQSLYDTSFDRTNAKLTDIWRQRTGSTAPVPDIASLEEEPTDLRSPFSDNYQYLALCCESTADLICRLAGEAQSVLRHQKLVGLFFGYYTLGYGPESILYWNTSAYEKVWRSPDIDMLYSPAAYGEHRFLSGVSSYQYCVDSIALHHKLYLHENDHRTDLARFPLENGCVLTDCYDTFEEWREVFRRELANVMLKNASFWWFDFFGGYYNAPEYERELTLETGLYRKMNRGERHSTSEIAVFLDPMSFQCVTVRSSAFRDLTRLTIMELHRCGAPFDVYNLNDLPEVPLDRYKLFIIPQAYAITDPIRRFILEKLSDRYVVFQHGSGMRCGDSFDSANVASLCGLPVRKIEADGNLHAVYNGIEFGFTRDVRTMFAVEESPQTEVLARYTDGQVCAARSGRHVYCAVGPAPWQFWRDLARSAGVFLYSEQGSGLAACSQFVCAYTTLTEDCVLNVPENGDWTEVFSGQTVRAENGKLTYHAPSGQTMLWMPENRYREFLQAE